MNNKININPSSTKWLEKDDRVVADYFCDLGFRSLKQILDMRVFDLMNMQGLNAVRVEEVIICLYKWLNPNTAIDEAIYNGILVDRGCQLAHAERADTVMNDSVREYFKDQPELLRRYERNEARYILQLPKNYDTISIDFGIDKDEMKRLVIALAELDLTIDEWLCFKMKELILAEKLSKENRGEE